MNYRHHFHAGNIADLFKHAIWLRLLQRMQQKPAGLLILDSHSGTGIYELRDKAGQPSTESQAGFYRLLARYEAQPESQQLQSLQPLISLWRSEHLPQTPPFDWHLYAGSAWIAAKCKRPQDRLVAAELQAEEAESLRQNLRRLAKQLAIKNISVLAENGYGVLKSQLPPPERRSLVLIDPPYEAADEFERLSDHLKLAYQRFPSGCLVLWYPLVDRPGRGRAAIERLIGDVKNFITSDLLAVEFSPEGQDQSDHLNGSGMLIVNPPWQIESELLALAKALAYGLDKPAARIISRPYSYESVL